MYGTALATLFFLSVMAIIKYKQCKKGYQNKTEKEVNS